MDIFEDFGSKSDVEDIVIKTITMHTTGEPTRIVISGYPELVGRTLLDKRQCAKNKYDMIRKRLMHEPRGHRDMYGAILLAETELTASEEADIGVLFMHNEGYSTMCGHATIALGRFLIDTHDLTLFPRRNTLKFDPATSTTLLRLHAPCGVVQVSVPTKLYSLDGNNTMGRSDPSRPVSFLSVSSFAVATNLEARLPKELDWRSDSQSQRPIVFDIAYGGAFYVVVSSSELGFPELGRVPVTIVQSSKGYRYESSTVQELDDATKNLKAYVEGTYGHLIKHPARELDPQLKDLEFLYGVIVVDNGVNDINEGFQSIKNFKGADVNITFFASQQLDRSPTGSGVSARVALSIAKNELNLGDTRAYHSVVSVGVLGDGALEGKVAEVFLGSGTETILIGGGEGFEENGKTGVIVRVEGKAWYISKETFIVERGDKIGKEAFLI